MTSAPLVRASGIIIYNDALGVDNIRFLLLKSSNRPYHWTPPKGRLDPGESTIDAAHRETFEESGLDRSSYALDHGFKETLYYKAHELDKECVYHLARLTDPSAEIVLSSEHTQYEWVKLPDVPKYCDKESLVNMLNNAHAYLKTKLG